MDSVSIGLAEIAVRYYALWRYALKRNDLCVAKPQKFYS
jgi:hypothetical protein